MLYFGLDGDSIGRVVESYLIKNDVDSLSQFSKKIVDALNAIKKIAEEKGATIIFCTGDSILIYGEIEIEFGDMMLRIFNEKTQKTASVGIGDNLAKTYLGLKLAKSNGGNQSVFYQMKKYEK